MVQNVLATHGASAEVERARLGQPALGVPDGTEDRVNARFCWPRGFSPKGQGKEGVLTPRTPFGMTRFAFFRKL
jgi:hypothetical protein